jgi:cytosine/adenosine deaminase-related metal-dependent hydrolase
MLSHLRRSKGAVMDRESARSDHERRKTTALVGARLAVDAEKSFYGSLEIAGERITQIVPAARPMHLGIWPADEFDLSGYLVLPGLINAHDHLEFSLYPRLADPPYGNYVEWGEDIHAKFADAIARQHAVPKEVRLWWGGIRNLLCGVTTVCHHNPLWPELQKPEFPIRIATQNGWSHSLALGDDLRAARAAAPQGRPFIIHACEGTDDLAQRELWQLDELSLLDENTVLVHGLAVDRDGAALIKGRRASLIICPSSNHFLYGRFPDFEKLRSIEKIAIGNDSPLSAAGDLLNEVRFAVDACRIAPAQAYRMSTTLPASILHLGSGEGSIAESGVADLIAVRNTSQSPADRLRTLSAEDVELVMIGGRVQLASGPLRDRLPPHATQRLEPLEVSGAIRWLRAPVRRLLDVTEAVLGEGGAHLGERKISAPALVETCHAC